MKDPERQSIESLVSALQEQTEAINRLANSNAMLANVIAAQYDEEPETSTTYLDGSSA